MEIGFHIPDFGVHFRLNNILIGAMKSRPEYFHDGLKIKSVFGAFPGSVWNGGRYQGGATDMRTVNAIIKMFNDNGIPLRFTFTNPLIKKEHLGDSFCNQVLRAADGGFNEVIVMSPVLEEYIRENYPKYPITSSTCKQLEAPEDVREELKKDYKYVVLDYNWNNKFDMLEKIAPEDRGKCEILANACCEARCPRRGEHYRQIGEEHIKAWEYQKNPMNRQPYKYEEFQCPHMLRSIYNIRELENYVSPRDILEKYAPMGFRHFKIEGRTTVDINLLETYVHYMVKPEYRDEARFMMMVRLTKSVKYFIK